MEPKKRLSDRSERSLEQELQAIIPEQCAGCHFPESVLIRTLMNYRTGVVRRREAETYVQKIFGDIEQCSGLVSVPISLNEQMTRCGMVSVAQVVQTVEHVDYRDDELPIDEACV